MHEDQIGLIEEYTNIEHMKCVLEELQKGVRKCEKLFINPGSECSSESRSSRSESANTEPSDPDELTLRQQDSDMQSGTTMDLGSEISSMNAQSMIISESELRQRSVQQKLF